MQSIWVDDDMIMLHENVCQWSVAISFAFELQFRMEPLEVAASHLLLLGFGEDVSQRHSISPLQSYMLSDLPRDHVASHCGDV